MKTQLIILRSCTPELTHQVQERGAIAFLTDSCSIEISRPPIISSEGSRVQLPPDSVREINRSLALSCKYGDNVQGEQVQHQLKCSAIAIQLVKPCVDFLNLWLQLDNRNAPQTASRDVSDLGKRAVPEPYLSYQQHNCLTACG